MEGERRVLVQAQAAGCGAKHGDGEGEYDHEVEDEEGCGLGVRLIGVATRVLVRVLVQPVWEVCMDGMRLGEFGKNLKGTGE